MSGDEPGSARIGPYHVVRHLVSGPGAQMLEAASESGEQVLLQIARCRAARSSAEDADRKQLIESMRAATEALGDELEIRQHGSADSDGEMILFWALPWDERAVDLGLAKIDDADELVSVGIHLARRLAALHAEDRLDPLLSERLLVIKDGEPWVAGVPVRVPERWLSPGMRPARLAPEETLAKEPTRAGDVWRLGQALKALTVYLERLPTRVWRALELIGHPDAGIRARTAAEALSMMESLADPHAPDPPSVSEITSAKLPDDETSTIADEPVSGPRRLLHDSATEPGTKPPLRHSQQLTEGDTLLDFPMPLSNGGDGVVVLEPSEDTHPTLDEAAIPPIRKKRASWDVAGDEGGPQGGPTGTVLAQKPSSLLKRQTTLPGVRRIEPAALPRLLPPPSGALAGPLGTLVGTSPVEPYQIMRVPRPAVLPAEDPIEPSSEHEGPPNDAEDIRVDPVPSPRTAAIAVLTLIIGLLLGAAASKGLKLLDDQPGLLTPALSVPRSSVVRLDAQPAATAVVVSEEDGRVLGSTPLWFQIPLDHPVAVLVTAPGHEPMRVVLPDRGKLEVELEPIYDERESCQVNLHVPQNVPVESVGSTIEAMPSGFQVPGSGVIRAVGEIRGAWLLRCPKLGEDVLTLPGRQLEKEIELRISSPPDMEVWIDGTVAGTSPMRKRVPSGFKHIRIQSAQGRSLERWVPAFHDTEIEFSDPN